MMRRTPILLLDVMGTLVYDPYRVELPAFFGCGFEELYGAVDREVWPAFERAELDPQAFAARFFADDRVVDYEGLVACLRRSYRYIDGIPELLGDLRDAGVEMHALSNYPLWYRIIEEELGLTEYLSWSFVSCETGVRKPDPQAYLGAADELGVAPADLLFVDDREVNCEAARQVGAAAIRFESAAQLRRALIDAGLL